uniref:Carboxypeptidase inhibitor n=1 Tax=Rhipicephalus zambeziensis TaxID=60191 RepID=A0A224YBM5_9ACAR
MWTVDISAMVSFRLLCVLCLVSGMIARKPPSTCESKGFVCRFTLFCSWKNKVQLGGCGFLKTCCKRKEQTCKSMHGICQNKTATCAGLRHDKMACGKSQTCCVPTVH